MYFWCFGFRGELGFLNCDDVCMCVVNKQFELLEFVSESVYVDLQYDEISLTFLSPYGYLLSDMYLFMADITNPDFLVLSCRTWIGLDITRFCEQQCQPSSGSAWPACPKNGKSGPHCWGRGGSTQFAQQLEFAVTAPPLVGCVVWSL